MNLKHNFLSSAFCLEEGISGSPSSNQTFPIKWIVGPKFLSLLEVTWRAPHVTVTDKHVLIWGSGGPLSLSSGFSQIPNQNWNISITKEAVALGKTLLVCVNNYAFLRHHPAATIKRWSTCSDLLAEICERFSNRLRKVQGSSESKVVCYTKQRGFCGWEIPQFWWFLQPDFSEASRAWSTKATAVFVTCIDSSVHFPRLPLLLPSSEHCGIEACSEIGRIFCPPSNLGKQTQRAFLTDTT